MENMDFLEREIYVAYWLTCSSGDIERNTIDLLRGKPASTKHCLLDFS